MDGAVSLHPVVSDIDLLGVFDDLDLGDQLNFEVNASSPDIEYKDYSYSSVQDRHFLKSIAVNETFIISFGLKANLIDLSATAAK